jgi:hypothetical protein
VLPRWDLSEAIWAVPATFGFEYEDTWAAALKGHYTGAAEHVHGTHRLSVILPGINSG